MSGFGFHGKTDSFVNTSVTNDGFYPDLVLGQLQTEYRIPAEFEQATVIEHLSVALVQINARLASQQMIWIEQGYSQLADVPSTQINNENITDILYRRAVFCQAKALLIKQFASMSFRKDAEHAVLQSSDNEQFWLSEATKAVKALLSIDDDVEYSTGKNITAEIL